MLTLRPYQVEPIKKAIAFFREQNPEPSLMVCPTGWGKSLMAAEVAAACPDPILVVQPTKELLEQNLDKYRLLCGDLAPAGIYSASFGKKQIDHVTFATIGSIKNIGTQFKQLGFHKMLIDEAHLYPRKEQSMLGEFLRDSGIRHVLGLTATPLKLESFSEKQGDHYDKWSELIMLTNLTPSGRFFKHILHVSQIQEMTEMGFWTPLRYEVLPFSREHLTLNSTGNEYTEESTVSAYIANNIRENIIAALEYHQERKHVLVFVPTVEEAEALPYYCPDSAVITGQTPTKERQRLIAAFKEGTIRTIINVGVLATGFDYPEIDMIVTGFSTASVAKYYQILGRGVRIHPNKRDCLIVDAGGNYQRFGRIEDIRYEVTDRWRMFGTGGTLTTGIPINAIGLFHREDLSLAYTFGGAYSYIGFGKHKGKTYDQVPSSYLQWLLSSQNGQNDIMQRAQILRAMENHVRDTRYDPPLDTFPDGKHAGKHMGTVPAGYIKYYYRSKEWNETNDSLRRGLELFIENN